MIDAEDINRPGVVAEVEAAFHRYESALTGNDVSVLDELFWHSDCTLRYGVGENLYGIEAIRAFRQARSPAGLARTLRNTVVSTFGNDFAAVNTEFCRAAQSVQRSGRQSQTWVRFPVGWRIVAAHVSMFE